MTRKKILWLCSWYPGKTDPFNGDFIQRHARAAAIYNDIYVIHVIAAPAAEIKGNSTDIQYSPGLSEHNVYVKQGGSIFSRIIGRMNWLASFCNGIKAYIRENGKPDLVHVHVPMKAGLFALWIKRKYGVPFIVTEHWGIYNEVEKLNYESRSPAFKYYTKKIFAQASHFISVSNFLAEGVNRLVIQKEFDVIPNVVDTRRFFYREKSPGRFRFIHVSNMVPLKNWEGILEAFKLLLARGINAELVVVGDKHPEPGNYATSLGLHPSKIFFRGEVSYEQVASEMQEADCLILFSDIENSPCVIGEALCSGLPVIATKVGGIPELVDDTNSLLVEARDTTALSIQMENMIACYPTYNRKTIAENAFKKFSYDIAGKRMDIIYSETIRSST